MINELNNDTTIKQQKVFLSENEIAKARTFAVKLTKSHIPFSHKRLADNYLIIKKVFKFQACLSRITNVEKTELNKYDMSTLEYTTTNQMYSELELLQQWASNGDAEKKQIAENILIIRIKELKFLEASCHSSISNEIYGGYKVLEFYLKEISKFRNSQYMSFSKL